MPEGLNCLLFLESSFSIKENGSMLPNLPAHFIGLIARGWLQMMGDHFSRWIGKQCLTNS